MVAEISLTVSAILSPGVVGIEVSIALHQPRVILIADFSCTVNSWT